MSIYLTFTYKELNFNNTSNPVYSIVNGVNTKVGIINLYTTGDNIGNAVLDIKIPIPYNNLDDSWVINSTYEYKKLSTLISSQKYNIYPISWKIADQYDFNPLIYKAYFTIFYDDSTNYFTQTISFNPNN